MMKNQLATLLLSLMSLISNGQTPEQLHESKKFIQTQDSLRALILNSKPNENLKSSILQELYIRNLIRQENDKIIFHLPFNLHGLDCGAPDCYSTDISFEISATIPIEFPQKINFNLHEHGCVEKEIKVNGVFVLVEKSSEFINYYSKKLKSNLIIKKGTELYYYPHQETHPLRVATIDKMFENQNFEKENALVPYRSHRMISVEYEYFVKNK